MPREPFLFSLAERLQRGLQRLTPERRALHRAFVLSQQMPDGGFRGREGDSDLYYTGFAVRSLAILGGLDPELCGRIGTYLQSNAGRQLSVIDLVSWLYAVLVVQASGGIDILGDRAADFAARMTATFEGVRTADGGYAKTTEGAAGSTYHSFLVALCYELVGQSPPEPNRLIQFVYDRQREDGGFVEIAPMKRSGTNPTAAAAALLRMHGTVDDELRGDLTAFLREVRSGEGGFQANTRVPFADGLSTFTALLTLQDLNLGELIPPAQIETFINSLEMPGGGFRGASWDEQADVEYTFYGLGVLGLLWSRE